MLHGLGVVLRQRKVDEKTNEIPEAPEFLRSLVLEGRVVTMDALLTQREVARTIVEEKGDYVMIVKKNQPELYESIDQLFKNRHMFEDTFELISSRDCGHGRLETRELMSSTALKDYLDWPGQKQVFRIQRDVVEIKSEKEHHEIVYGITSLNRERGTAARLLKTVRAHWEIENRIHWVRDVTFDEDRSQVRTGTVARIMTTFRNLAISLHRLAGATNIAAATRAHAAKPKRSFALLGIQLDN